MFQPFLSLVTIFVLLIHRNWSFCIFTKKLCMYTLPSVIKRHMHRSKQRLRRFFFKYTLHATGWCKVSDLLPTSLLYNLRSHPRNMGSRVHIPAAVPQVWPGRFADFKGARENRHQDPFGLCGGASLGYGAWPLLQIIFKYISNIYIKFSNNPQSCQVPSLAHTKD
jgi:hypothetical protein